MSKLVIKGGAASVIAAIARKGLDLSDNGGVMDAVQLLQSEFERVTQKLAPKET